jgi:mediator of RNA polymerase II transcription subunit 13
MLLHFAYQPSECGRWLVATCTDQAGHASDVKVWVLAENGEEEDPIRARTSEIVQYIWEFIIGFARKADIEWRVIVTRIGCLEEAELQGSSLITNLILLAKLSVAWHGHVHSFFSEQNPKSYSLAEMHISLLSVQTSVPWFFMPTSFKESPQISNASNMKNMVYMDITSTTYFLDLIPGLHAGLFEPILQVSSPTAEDEITPSPLPPLSVGPVPALLTTALVRIPQAFPTSPTSPSTTLVHLLHNMASPDSCMHKPLPDHFKDIINSFYDLQVLASARWGEIGNRLGLPIHIAVLGTVMKRLPTFSEPSVATSPS